MAIEIICDECGSDNVSRDAWAMWDRDLQEWTLGAVFDDGHCHACDARVHLREWPLSKLVEERR